jgi:limonene 1,2-monooxygenase
MAARRIRFGIFMPPFNSPSTQGATSSLMRNVETIKLLDELGYDEAWVGEHHSAGAEIIADPLLFLMHVAGQTRHIRLGTGVISLPYHNPFMVAERMVLLDHLSRGRAIMGFGPGQLASDAHMIGLDAGVLRERMLEAAEVVVRLCRGEVVTAETEWFSLRDARLQVLPYSRPTIDTVVAAVASPAGPRTAGRLGVGMINLAATSPAAFAALRDHWSIVEAEAAGAGTQVSRADWRLAGIMHIAETAEQAREDCRYGFEEIWGYLGEISPLPSWRSTSAGRCRTSRSRWPRPTT